MTGGCYRFQNFVLYPDDRKLLCKGVPVDLSARYFDALALMVRAQGKLVTKEQFLEDVWRGVPVTDEALTQCIRTLRKQLGDEAAKPHLIETVVKHGYRFMALVEWQADDHGPPSEKVPGHPSPPITPSFLRLTVAGAIGAGVAGLLGGLIYGFAASAQPTGTGMGAISVMFVVVCLTVFIAMLGGAGVSAGMAVARRYSDRPAMMILGGLCGGAVIGAVVKLIGLDAFSLLFGQAPGDITGAPEGALLGGAVGAGAALAQLMSGHKPALRIAAASAVGALSGALIPLLGGRLMAGSLALMGAELPHSRLRLDTLSAMVGEADFGLISRIVTGGIEGALFSGCIVAALIQQKIIVCSWRSSDVSAD